MKKLLCSLFALSAISTAMAQEVNIKLLGTSDVHGRIVPWSYGADVEDKSGSYAQIATYVKDVRKNNKNVVLVEVGDAIQDNQIDVFAKDKKYYKDKVSKIVGSDMFYTGILIIFIGALGILLNSKFYNFMAFIQITIFIIGIVKSMYDMETKCKKI